MTAAVDQVDDIGFLEVDHAASGLRIAAVGEEIHVANGLRERQGPFQQIAAVGVDHIDENGVGGVQASVRVFQREGGIGGVQTGDSRNVSGHFAGVSNHVSAQGKSDQMEAANGGTLGDQVIDKVAQIESSYENIVCCGKIIRADSQTSPVNRDEVAILIPEHCVTHIENGLVSSTHSETVGEDLRWQSRIEIGATETRWIIQSKLLASGRVAPRPQQEVDVWILSLDIDAPALNGEAKDRQQN